jgi:sulfotransferase
MKNLFFVSGLPRSGSTLLMNILGQHPDVYVTPTSGCHEVLWTTRNNWNTFVEHQSDPMASSPKNLQRVLRSMMYSYHDTDKNIIFDKHRSWTHSIELLEFILNGPAKIIIPVRSISEILASFEQVYRKSAHLHNTPGDFLSSQTTEGRVNHWISNRGEVGIAYNRIKDVFQRGYGDRLLLVEFDALTYSPESTMNQIWDFLKIDAPIHDFNNVIQLTKEDDSYTGYDGLHDIRSKVLPVPPKANRVLGEALSNKYKNVEFWR